MHITRTRDIYVKRVGQRVLQFPPTANVDRGVGVSPLTDPSTVAVLRDQT